MILHWVTYILVSMCRSFVLVWADHISQCPGHLLHSAMRHLGHFLPHRGSLCPKWRHLDSISGFNKTTTTEQGKYILSCELECCIGDCVACSASPAVERGEQGSPWDRLGEADREAHWSLSTSLGSFDTTTAMSKFQNCYACSHRYFPVSSFWNVHALGIADHIQLFLLRNMMPCLKFFVSMLPS